MLAFELGGAEHAQRGENFVAQDGEQLEGDVVVGILLEVAQPAAHGAAKGGEADDPAPRELDLCAQPHDAERLGDARRAEDGDAHRGDKADRAVEHGEDHDV